MKRLKLLVASLSCATLMTMTALSVGGDSGDRPDQGAAPPGVELYIDHAVTQAEESLGPVEFKAVFAASGPEIIRVEQNMVIVDRGQVCAFTPGVVSVVTDYLATMRSNDQIALASVVETSAATNLAHTIIDSPPEMTHAAIGRDRDVPGFDLLC